MVHGVDRMAMRDMRMVAGFLVVALFVMFRRFAMMARRVFMMFGGRFVMLDLGFAHGHLPSRSSAKASLPRLRAGGVTRR